MLVRCSVLFLILNVACLPSAVFKCDSNGDCGENGQCESTEFCSFGDSACESGMRYGEYAGDGLANQCVGGDAGCPSDAIVNEATGHCYLEFFNDTEWEDARDDCRDLPGGDWYLVDVVNEAENDFLAERLDSNIEYWLGGSDRDQEGVWRWTNGAMIETVYHNWTGNSPNRDGENNDDCIEFSGNQGAWRDIDCGDDRDYVCERG